MLLPIRSFLTEIVEKRRIILELAKRDFQRQYRSSYLGLTWIFLQPLLFFVILYLVFSVGFRIQETSTGVPFALYLIAGMVSWHYFSSNLGTMSHVLENHAFLIKRTDFSLNILPLTVILSSLVAHAFLVLVAIGLCWHHGYAPTLYTLQIFYYLIAMQMLLLSLGWITSSTNLFARDIAKIVEVFIQFGFWLTPIFWSIKQIPESYRWLVKLNPAYYLVTGYRDSLIEQTGFWERPLDTLYFWMITLILMTIGIIIFRRLKPHFADVI